jgi:lysophospholipase
MKVRFASEAGKNIIWLQDHAHELNVPCLFLQGSEDSLVDTDATVDFYNKVKEEDKKLIVYEGFYHEIFNEPESFQGGKKRVFSDVDEWLLPRI